MSSMYTVGTQYINDANVQIVASCSKSREFDKCYDTGNKIL